MTRLLIADDHDLVRDMIADYLRSSGGFDVCLADSLHGALQAYAAQRPIRLILLDYAMPGMEALSGLARMKAQAACPVAILSGTAPPDVARRALRAGAAGFLPKTLALQSLLAAVRHMLAGEVYTPFDFLSRERCGAAPGQVALTGREGDVLHGLVEGKSNKEIARDLEIQEVTVKLHLKTLSRKLGARNRTHAAMLARDMGLLH